MHFVFPKVPQITCLQHWARENFSFPLILRDIPYPRTGCFPKKSKKKKKEMIIIIIMASIDSKKWPQKYYSSVVHRVLPFFRNYSDYALYIFQYHSKRRRHLDIQVLVSHPVYRCIYLPSVNIIQKFCDLYQKK